MPSENTSIPVSPPGIWHGQQLHWVSLMILIPVTFWLWVETGSPVPVLFWTTIAIPILHQLFVWLTWRLELNFKTITQSIGLKFYLVVFFILLFARPVFVGALAWMDRGSLGLSNIAIILISIPLALIWIYTAYSIKTFFGFYRASGADHFDESIRRMKLVKEGIFKYTSNGMYVAGFFILWLIAIGFDSKAALIAAGFNHIYIWVHYLSTEKPDMDYLYGS